MIPLVLASASSARAAILAGAGVAFTAVLAGIDEDAVKRDLARAGAGPRAVAEALAEAKATVVSRRQGGLVIGADQTLDLDGALFDKAPDLAAARTRLRALRGRAHLLHAALAVARDGKVIWRTTDSPRLTMRAFSDAFLDDYL
ncbi:MAG: Maf family protein, partial [Caulobacteraceae bacterium]